MQVFDVAVLGAGAAGMMAAATAGHRGRSVLLLDHADRPGKKVLISGGGRANFTNLHCTHENFLSENPNFARSALSRFTPADMVALVEKHGIAYHEKTLGQLFCDRSARDLVTLLERECADAKVQLALETGLVQLTRADSSAPGKPDQHSKPGARFTLETTRGSFAANSVIVATGGLSIPKLGATGIGYELARQFGLHIVEPRPGLVPLTLGGMEFDTWCDLAGVATDVVASLPARPAARQASRQAQFREKLLITHRGLSGPAVLQLSSFWSPGNPVELDLAPGEDPLAGLLAPRARRDRTAALAALRSRLPTRLAERVLEVFGGDAANVKDLSNAAIADLSRQLHQWRLTPSGTEGFAKAEVTAGGVDTAELDPRTLAARKLPGLYFIGEVVDVTGWLGGFNFQWAWASGFAAGQSA